MDDQNAALLGQPSRLDRVFRTIERIGGRIPDPFLLFVYLIIILAMSCSSPWAFTRFGWRSSLMVTIIKAYDPSRQGGTRGMDRCRYGEQGRNPDE